MMVSTGTEAHTQCRGIYSNDKIIYTLFISHMIPPSILFL
jgi:hypothetical protein